jgi:hypothetical protein
MMPKLSVSVPDELWERAQAVAPESGPSQLVQAALRRYVAGATGRLPLLRQRSPESRALLEQVLQRVVDRTQATYDDGYRAGLEFAEAAPWKLIETLAQNDWSLGNWLEEWQNLNSTGHSSPEEQVFCERVQRAATAQYHQDATFRAGFADGLRDLWQALTGEVSDVRGGEDTAGSDPGDRPSE